MGLTHAELKQLRYLPGMLRLLKKEYRQLREELEKHIVTDSVTGSDEEAPYIAHAISIRGVEDTEEARILEGRIQRKREEIVDCERKIQEMEFFIQKIRNLQLRKIFELYYSGRRKTWQEVAFLCGWTDESTPREKAKKYLLDPENPDFGEV